jgi:hypothetical protein
VVDAPWIAAHVADTGTHRQPFLGVPATGRSVSTPGDRPLREHRRVRVLPRGSRPIAEAWGTAFHVHLLEQVRWCARLLRPQRLAWRFGRQKRKTGA